MYSRLRPALRLSDLLAAVLPFMGSVVKFENEFAKKFKRKHGVMFSHGRSGLYTLMKVWELENAEVICPAYTCVVVPHAIVLSGNVPVFVDCAKGSWNMDYNGISNAISTKTRAIVVTHLFGYPMDVQRVEKIVHEAEQKFGHKIYIIQDVAHSYGAKSNGKLVTESGDAAFFGLNISKILTSVFGGMVITNDEDTYNNMCRYRKDHFKKKPFRWIKRLLYLGAAYIAFIPFVYGVIYWLEQKGFLDSFTKYYEEDRIYFPGDWDEQPSDLEARVGLSQLKRYDSIIKARINNAETWQKKLKGEEIEFLDAPEGTSYSHCVGLVNDRESRIETYLKKGIQLGILIEYCVPDMKAYSKYGQAGTCPIATSYATRTINFPNYPDYRKW